MLGRSSTGRRTCSVLPATVTSSSGTSIDSAPPITTKRPLGPFTIGWSYVSVNVGNSDTSSAPFATDVLTSEIAPSTAGTLTSSVSNISATRSPAAFSAAQ